MEMTTLTKNPINVKTSELPSLEELEARRLEMIDTAQAEELFSKIVTICKELGQPFECPYPANQRLRGEYSEGDLRLRFYDTPAPHGCTRLVVQAWVNEVQVCNMVVWNGKPDITKHTFVVLGRWCERVNGLAEKAEARIVTCVNKSREARRQELAEQLLIGMEV
jgi:hypothetical protein